MNKEDEIEVGVEEDGVILDLIVDNFVLYKSYWFLFWKLEVKLNWNKGDLLGLLDFFYSKFFNCFGGSNIMFIVSINWDIEI